MALVSCVGRQEPAAGPQRLHARFEGDQGVDDGWGDVTVAAHGFALSSRLWQFVATLQKSAPAAMVSAALALPTFLKHI